MVLDRGQRFAVELGVADDAAVGRDERDARADQAAERVGLGVELGGRRRPADATAFRRPAAPR